MITDTIQEIDKNIKEAKKFVDLGNALERLKLNRDFQKVIQQGYFEQEAIRLVHLKADPTFQTPERQQSIITQMDAIGSLSEYFVTVAQKASIAARSIEDGEQVREELLAEENE